MKRRMIEFTALALGMQLIMVYALPHVYDLYFRRFRFGTITALVGLLAYTSSNTGFVAGFAITGFAQALNFVVIFFVTLRDVLHTDMLEEGKFGCESSEDHCAARLEIAQGDRADVFATLFLFAALPCAWSGAGLYAILYREELLGMEELSRGSLRDGTAGAQQLL